MSLEARLAKLETENRRLRRLVMVTLGVALLPFLAGYATPNDKIEASEFAVRDKGGTVRARLFVDESGKTRLVLRDKDGSSPAILTSGEGASLSVADKKGKTNVVLTASSSKGVIIVEEDGKPRAVLSPPKPIDVDAQDPWATPD
ncbi:MAG: hypothetical protein ACXWUG_04955 [Polyangiales bacterium]